MMGINFVLVTFLTLLVSDLVNTRTFSEDTRVISKSFPKKIPNLSKSRVSESERSEILELRNFPLDRRKLWPTSVIPYEIDPSFNTWQQKKIGKVIKLFQQVSCVRFVPRTAERDYIRYSRSTSVCASPIGRRGGRQDILVSDDCFYLRGYRGAIVHETMHALGFVHEHQRTDRDCYVIVSGQDHRTDLQLIAGLDTGFPYDFQSIMHYKQHGYLNGRNGERLGNPVGTLSALDKEKLNYLYCGKPHHCALYPEACAATEVATRPCRVNA